MARCCFCGRNRALAKVEEMLHQSFNAPRVAIKSYIDILEFGQQATITEKCNICN